MKSPPTGWLTGSGHVALELVPASPPASRWSPPAAATPVLAVAPYDRAVDTTWKRTSYTGLTAGLHAADAPERAPLDHRADEPDDKQPLPPEGIGDATPSAGLAMPSRFAVLPAGAAFGTLVHGILEEIDTDAADLSREVLGQCTTALSRRPFPGVLAEDLSQAVSAALRTPLGPLAEGRALADVRRADRLPELDFELPLAQARARAPWPTWPPCCAAICPPTTRWSPMPTRCPANPWVRRSSAAT